MSSVVLPVPAAASTISVEERSSRICVRASSSGRGRGASGGTVVGKTPEEGARSGSDMSSGGPGYHTEHGLTGAIGAPALQEKASANAGTSATTPLTRKRGGECGLVLARSVSASGRIFSHHDCPKARKNS